jgi:phage anti-repressor protein
MLTKLALKAQLHDCDRRILLNHARQEAMVFPQDGSRDAAEKMLGLKSEMSILQSERAEVQAEVINQRNPFLQPTAMA